MASKKQIAANRKNAQLSTGPTSEAGREAVSQNRTTHGLSGEFKAQLGAEVEEYKRLFDTFINDFDPHTHTEFEFIHKMVEALIRSSRAVRLQDDCVDELPLALDDQEAARLQKQLELYMRYQASYDRAFQRYSAELRKFQTEFKKTEIGFESQKRREAQNARAVAQEIRREKNENRRREQHEVTILTAKARLEHQQLLNRKLAGQLPAAETPKNTRSKERLAA